MAIGVQDHIHMDFVKGAGPEYSPVTTYAIAAVAINPYPLTEVRRSLNNKAHIFTMKNESGYPVVQADYQVDIRLHDDETSTASQKFRELVKKAGQLVWFVPSEHPDNGEDHTAYTYPMFFAQCEFSYVGPLLQIIVARCFLQDISKNGLMTSTAMSGVTYT